MSNQPKNKSSSEKPFVDRRKTRGGIQEGGRRKSDRSPLPQSKASRIWFCLSLVLTVLIMIWTFSVPFRTKKPILSWEKPKTHRPELVAPEVKADPEHQMSVDEYRDYAWEIEQELLDLLAKKNEVPKNLPGAQHAAQRMEKRAQSIRNELKMLAKMESRRNGKSDLDPRSIEGLRIKELREQLESDNVKPQGE